MAAAALVGCGSDDRTASTASTAEPTAVSEAESEPTREPVPARLRGTYSMRSERVDALPFIGRWSLKLQAKRWTMDGPHGEHNAGDVSYDGARLIFLDDGTCGDDPGIYKYKLDGGTLRLRPEGSDPCNGREIKLTWSADPWHRRR